MGGTFYDVGDGKGFWFEEDNYDRVNHHNPRGDDDEEISTKR